MIEESLKENSDFKEQIVGYENLVIDLKSKLRTVPYYFVHFSRHDQSHSEKIIQYIEKLLGEDNIDKLSSSDKIMILLSCYSHDIGMALEFEQIKDLFSSSNFDDILKNNLAQYPDFNEILNRILYDRDYYVKSGNPGLLKLYTDIEIIIENTFRKEHASRSAEYICKNDSFRNLLGLRCTNFLSKICKSHDQDIKSILALPQKENGIFNDYFHPRFVAGLLSFCDLLDMDTDRFDPVFLSASSELPLLSDLHRRKHESLAHYLVEKSEIEIVADCDSIDVYRVMRQWIDWIKTAAEFLTLNWHIITPFSSIKPPFIKQCRLLINGNEKWVGFANKKLSFDVKKATLLLQGSNIYRGKLTFVRELIQNAVDASLIQLYLDCESLINETDCFVDSFVNLLDNSKINIHDYDIEGRIYKDSTGIKFELSDHGTGIADSEVPLLAELRGKSDRLKSIIKKMPEVLKPAGSFGIGLQSVFLVASKIEIYTKFEGEEAKIITIEDPARTAFVYVEPFSEKDILSDALLENNKLVKNRLHKRGTTVIVTIDENKFSQKDLNVADYVFKKSVRTNLVFDLLCHFCNNCFNYGMLPSFYDFAKRSDFFEIKITEFIDSAKNERPILILNSIFDIKKNSEICSNIDYTYRHDFFYDVLKKPKIIEQKESIYYRGYDKKYNCLFEAIIPYPFCRSLKKESIKNNIYVCGFEQTRNTGRRFYNQNIWYRNSFVESGILNERLGERHRLYNFLDFNINLFSDNADEVVTFDHLKIRDDYLSDLERIVISQVKRLSEEIIDFYLEQLKQEFQDNQAEISKVFLLFYLSVFSDYKCQVVINAYKDILSKIYIDEFFDLDGKQEPIQSIELSEKLLTLCVEITDDNYKAIFNSYSRSRDDINFSDSKTYLYNPSRFTYQLDMPKSNLFTYQLVDKFFEIKNEKLYFMFNVKVLKGEFSKEGVDYSDIFKYIEIIRVVNGINRCINVPKGYESLSTPLINGISNRFGNKRNFMIEFMIDFDICMEIIKELSEKQRIHSASYYCSKIFNSKAFKNNLDFICECNGRTKSDEIEQKYRKLYLEYIGLLERKDFSKIFDDVRKLVNNRNLFEDNYDDLSNYHNFYHILVFSKESNN